MKNWKEKIVFCLYVIALAPTGAYAQNMNNPYSIYGIGDIDFRAYNRTSGMASTGIALPSSFYFIDNNPAAITGLTRSFYNVDAAATGKTVHYTGSPINSDNSNAKDFWIKRLSLAVKLNNFWASAAGIRQFSNINYKYTGAKNEEGSATTYAADYQGDGGLNEYYWTNAILIGKHFSLGLESSVIAGAINQTETLNDLALQAVITTKQEDYMGQFHFKTGALYTASLNKKWEISLGAKYAPKTRMASERTLTVTDNSTTLVNNDYIRTNFFFLPNTYAAGIALKHNKKTTIALDYSYEDWSSLDIKGSGWQLISSNRLSGGVEFSKQKRIGSQLFEKKYFQMGAFINDSYLQIGDKHIREFGITGGMGGAISTSLLYNLSLEVGSRGTTQAGLIRENYVQLTIGFSFRDFLFSKGKQYN
jgi:hypothetical protein